MGIPGGFDEITAGDCIAGMEAMPAGSVDLVVADPPFNIGYRYDVYQDRRPIADYEQWCGEWMGQVRRVLRPHGTFWLAIGDEFAAELKVLATRSLGYYLRSWVLWYYTFGVNVARGFSRSHTHLLYFVKDPKSFTFNDDAIRVPSARQAVYGDRRADARGRLPDNTWILRPQDAPEAFTPGEDVWHVPRVNGTFRERAGWHGCQMPERVLARVVAACSDPGDVVLSPFGGSGTALAVAKKLGRVPVGFELSPDYAARIEARLDAITPGDPVAGADEPFVARPGRRKGEGVTNG